MAQGSSSAAAANGSFCTTPRPQRKLSHSLLLRQAAKLHRTLICCRVWRLKSALFCSSLSVAEAALSDTRGSAEQATHGNSSRFGCTLETEGGTGGEQNQARAVPCGGVE